MLESLLNFFQQYGQPELPAKRQLSSAERRILSERATSRGLLEAPNKRPRSTFHIENAKGLLGEGLNDPIPGYMSDIFKKEGGYSSSREDRGNWDSGKVGKGRKLGTNFGITSRSWAEFLVGDGKSVDKNDKEYKAELKNLTAKDMESITREQAIDFYKKRADKQFRMYRYPKHLQNQIFDLMTNSGYKRGIEILQQASGATVDGKWGKETGGAIQNLSNAKLADARVKYLKKATVTVDGKKIPLLKASPGLLNRAKSFGYSNDFLE